MMTIYAVRVGDDPSFIAHVFRDTESNSDRVWVCVRGGDTPVPASWVGFWSSKDERISNASVDSFSRELASKVREGGGVGPFGYFLREHYFFEGWDSWGNGTPMPLSSLTLSGIV